MAQQRSDRSTASAASPLRGCPYVRSAGFEGPVGLVVTRAGERANAMTVSFFSEVAHHPTSMWISISRDSFTHELLSENGEFSFITLQERQAGIAVACGTESGRSRDKCASLDLYDNGSGFLFLRGALASTACRIFRATPAGDHTIFLACMLSGDIDGNCSRLRNLLLSDLASL